MVIFLKKVLNKNLILEISKLKDEPEFIKDFRLQSLEAFNKLDMPNFGPKIKLDFNKITYF